MAEKRTLEDFLRERILNSGFPLEIEISNLLDNDYEVFNSKYYYDKEAENGRTIDIYAYPKQMNREGFNQIFPFFTLVLECKKSNSHAWIFFTRPTDKGYLAEYISGQIDSPDLPTEKNRLGIPSFVASTIKESLHYRKFERVAIAYDEIKLQTFEGNCERSGRDNRGRDDILEALMQLQKFLCYQHKRDKNFVEEVSFLVTYMPIIVFDGELFESYLDSGKLELRKTLHLIVKTDYFCPYCGKIEKFTIDVVHRKFFPEFLKQLKNDCLESTKTLLEQQQSIANLVNSSMDIFYRKTGQ